MFDSLFNRGGRVPQYANQIHNDVTWSDTDLQLARLVSAFAEVSNTKALKRVAARMSLPQEQLNELIGRAADRWEDVMSRTDRHHYYPTVETREYMLEDMALYDPTQPPSAEQLANSAPHLVAFEFNPVEGGALLTVEPEMIDYRRPQGLRVGVSIQHGCAELFIATATDDSCVIRSGVGGSLEVLLPQPHEEADTHELLPSHDGAVDM